MCTCTRFFLYSREIVIFSIIISFLSLHTLIHETWVWLQALSGEELKDYQKRKKQGLQSNHFNKLLFIFLVRNLLNYWRQPETALSKLRFKPRNYYPFTVFAQFGIIANFLKKLILLTSWFSRRGAPPDFLHISLQFMVSLLSHIRSKPCFNGF